MASTNGAASSGHSAAIAISNRKKRVKKTVVNAAPPDRRFDGLNHWIVSTGSSNEQNCEGERPKPKRCSCKKNGEGDGEGEKSKPKRRNCKQCTLDGSKDNKTVYMCEKCKVPLHTLCFKR